MKLKKKFILDNISYMLKLKLYNYLFLKSIFYLFVFFGVKIIKL